jgi:hypothetical protein
MLLFRFPGVISGVWSMQGVYARLWACEMAGNVFEVGASADQEVGRQESRGPQLNYRRLV